LAERTADAPRPTPTYLKLLRGNPGKRALNKREPQPDLPNKPPPPLEFLDGYALAEWKRVSVGLWRLGALTSLDVQVLAAYCDAYARWRTARETIAAMAERDQVMHGLIVKTQSGGGAANPLVWIAAAAARDMNRFASEFGMSPASRSTIATGRPVAPSKFAGLLGGTPRPPDLA
jgi:P27 family predicted phage terminase small subunit